MSDSQETAKVEALVFNRLQRKKLSKMYSVIFNDVKRALPELKTDSDKLAKIMISEYEKMRAMVNPTLEQKLSFLKKVAPDWNMDE
jgi:Na+/phosphate symporter